MIVNIVPNALRKLRKLEKRYTDIGDMLNDAFELYGKNSRSSKLRLHKLSNRDNEWSISLRPDLRVVFSIVGDEIRIINIGSHDEAYR